MKKQKIEYLELWEKFQNEDNEEEKDRIRQQLVEIYYPLVQKISYKVAERIKWKLQPEELSSFGVDGLYKAINRFSIHEGVDFPGYAYRRIGGSMIDGIRKEDIIPRSVRINNNLIEKIRDEIETETCNKASDYEIVKKLGIKQSDFTKNVKKYKPLSFVSIEGTSICNPQDDFQQDLLIGLKDKKFNTPDKNILKKEFLNKLISKNFSPLEQKIIYYYYYRSFSMGDIAKKLNMSESRISQIHTEILPRLKDKIKRNPNFFKEYLKNTDK